MTSEEIKPKVKKRSKEETKERNRKRIQELSEDSLGVIPHYDEPNEEQKEYVLFKLSHPETWPKVHENKIGDWKNWK